MQKNEEYNAFAWLDDNDDELEEHKYEQTLNEIREYNRKTEELLRKIKNKWLIIIFANIDNIVRYVGFRVKFLVLQATTSIWIVIEFIQFWLGSGVGVIVCLNSGSTCSQFEKHIWPTWQIGSWFDKKI